MGHEGPAKREYSAKNRTFIITYGHDEAPRVTMREVLYYAVHMPARGGADSGPVSGAGACARQVVHDRHPLPPADREGRGNGAERRAVDGLAAAPSIRQRADPRDQPR